MISNARSDRSSKIDAERIAIDAIAFLAGQPEALGRFLTLSGIDPTNLRQNAADPAFLGGILDFLLQDEPLLLAFADQSKLDPAAIAGIRRRLNGPAPDDNSD